MRDKILEAAIKIANKPNGLSKLTRESVAFRANCSPALVSHYYGTMDRLRAAVIAQAVARELLPIIVQTIITGDKTVPLELKYKALASL